MFSIHSASPGTAEVSKSDLKGEYPKHLLMVKNIRKLSFGLGVSRPLFRISPVHRIRKVFPPFAVPA